MVFLLDGYRSPGVWAGALELIVREGRDVVRGGKAVESWREVAGL